MRLVPTVRPVPGKPYPVDNHGNTYWGADEETGTYLVNTAPDGTNRWTAQIATAEQRIYVRDLVVGTTGQLYALEERASEPRGLQLAAYSATDGHNLYRHAFPPSFQPYMDLEAYPGGLR